MNSNYTTDNRWAPLGSGAVPPDDAPAAYAARWIDQGDHVIADIVPDRQGFAYNDKADYEQLIHLMGLAGNSFRTPHSVGLDKRDVTTVVMNAPHWKAYMRRAGGYIYVDAWLMPVVTEPPAVDEGVTRQYLVTIHDVGNITDDPRNIHTILTSTDNIQPRDRVEVIEVRSCSLCGAWTEPGKHCESCGTEVK